MTEPTDLTRSLPRPWPSFLLAVGGSLLLGASREPVLRLLGALLVLAGAIGVFLRTQRTRELVERLLAAIPIEQKDERVFRELPRAWARLEGENRSLRRERDQEDRLRQGILTHLREGLMVLTPDRRLRLFNPAAVRLLGSSSRLRAGCDWTEVFREPDCLQALEEAYTGQPREWVLRREPRVLRIVALPFPLNPGPDPQLGPAGLLLTLDDITRQEALETTRQKFISNASHELKTPTTAIQIAAEDLLDGGFVQPGGEASLRIILRAIERMTLLLEDISELSRIETGALELNPQRVDPAGFAERLVEDHRPRAEARRIELELSLPPELPPLVADPQRLGQLLDNLISNAIKFSPEGGRVRITLDREPGWVSWSVRDEGPGIALAEQSRVFERFYRSPATRGVPGTGLGLAIAKHLARLMGGELSLKSEPGKGATFTFRLPGADRNG